MRKQKDEKKQGKASVNVVKEFFVQPPQLQFNGNSEVIVEGSKGVLLYSEQEIKINTSLCVVCFFGRSLNLKCISVSELIINGFIEKVEFVM